MLSQFSSSANNERFLIICSKSGIVTQEHRVIPFKIEGREENEPVANASPTPTSNQEPAATQVYKDTSHTDFSAKKEKVKASDSFRFMVGIHVTAGFIYSKRT